MEIEFIYIPILICIISWFLAWVFSGFSNGIEAIAGNPITLIFSIIGYFSGLFCLIYYPYKLFYWLYDNINII